MLLLDPRANQKNQTGTFFITTSRNNRLPDEQSWKIDWYTILQDIVHFQQDGPIEYYFFSVSQWLTGRFHGRWIREKGLIE